MNNHKRSSNSISRRAFLGKTAGGVAGVAISNAIPNFAFAKQKVAKIGMNIPMTGDYAPWGLPGFYGCEIIADSINSNGGLSIGEDRYEIAIVAYDHGYDTEKAVQGYKKLVLEDEVEMVMMLGGSTVAAVLPFATRKKILTTTLLPSDITPKSKYLVATCESHPLYNVTGVEYLSENFPQAKSAVIVTTNDVEYGMQSAATYQAAFEVAGIRVLDVNLHGFDVTDFAPIISAALAHKPDIFCMATSVYTTPMMEQLYHQGFRGKIISCTLDGYPDVIAKTSEEFVNGTIFQFPDFDDPMLLRSNVNFPNPAKFDAAFKKNHAGEWSAVAWEYPAILLNWAEAAQAAGSVKSKKVLKAMQAKTLPTFVFGDGRWWGSQLWGLDNTIIGNWPVVVIENGKARIKEYRSLAGWLDKNINVLLKHMKSMGLRTV